MDFSANEWLRAVPFQYALKQLRNDVWLAFYKRCRPKSLLPFLKKMERFKGSNIALVIAFEQPWALDWMLRMAQQNLTDTAVLVFDNSRRTEARLEIERVCRDRGVPYLALPANPTRHVNRSHGMAMTWIFHNVVRAIQPRLFAFLDHDLIPVQKVAFSEKLSEQPFFGFTSFRSWGWSLWAGYCLYNFSSVSGLPLNFLYDFSRGLDTGGRNWPLLYQNYDHRLLRHAESARVAVIDSINKTTIQVQLVDQCWLHIGGIGYNGNFRAKLHWCEHLALALDQGQSWPSLIVQDETLADEGN
jgi:hypothetical protein